jgi:hypothetical protein
MTISKFHEYEKKLEEISQPLSKSVMGHLEALEKILEKQWSKGGRKPTPSIGAVSRRIRDPHMHFSFVKYICINSTNIEKQNFLPKTNCLLKLF